MKPGQVLNTLTCFVLDENQTPIDLEGLKGSDAPRVTCSWSNNDGKRKKRTKSSLPADGTLDPLEVS